MAYFVREVRQIFLINPYDMMFLRDVGREAETQSGKSTKGTWNDHPLCQLPVSEYTLLYEQYFS